MPLLDLAQRQHGKYVEILIAISAEHNIPDLSPVQNDPCPFKCGTMWDQQRQNLVP